jgi:site-specific recombinase XerD
MPVAAATFFEHVDSFFDYRKSIYETSDQTLRANRVDLNLFRNFLTEKHYDVIDGPCVMNFQYFLKNQRNNSGGSINRKIFTLRSYSKHLRLVDVPAADSLPFEHVLKIRQGYRQRPQALTTCQIARFFAAIDRTTVLGLRDYAIYALMYLAGLRVGELHLLNLASINFEKRLLTVLGKGRRLRTIELQDELQKILTEYVAVRGAFHNQAQSQALFISKKGNRLAIRTMEDNFRKTEARADLQAPFQPTCHSLRHSFASHLNDQEVDILVIQSLLGHSTPKSTEAYIHPSSKKIREAMEKLPAVIFCKGLIEQGVLNLRFQNNQPKRE